MFKDRKIKKVIKELQETKKTIMKAKCGVLDMIHSETLEYQIFEEMCDKTENEINQFISEAENGVYSNRKCEELAESIETLHEYFRCMISIGLGFSQTLPISMMIGKPSNAFKSNKA